MVDGLETRYWEELIFDPALVGQALFEAMHSVFAKVGLSPWVPHPVFFLFC